MNKTVENELKKWVEKNYDRDATGWTVERSRGHYEDCFEDGSRSGTSWAAYEVGCILGMDLEDPDEPDYEY